MREYLAALDDEALPGPAARRGSLSDPHARWTAAKGGVAFFAYSTNYLIDTAHGVILDVEATPAHRNAEVDSTKAMVDRVESRFDLKPQRLIADTAYGTAPILGWMVEQKGIEPHIPVFDKIERKDGTFERDAFRWDEAADEYRCPADKPLRKQWRMFKKLRTHITQAETIIYRAQQSDCSNCTMKSLCCPNMRSRMIHRSIHEDARDVARQIATTLEYQRSCCERKKVEMLFAHLKSILKLDRLRLRGLTGATDEFTLAGIAQDLRHPAELTSQGPPSDRRGAPAYRKTPPINPQTGQQSPYEMSERAESRLQLPAATPQTQFQFEFFNRIGVQQPFR